MIDVDGSIISYVVVIMTFFFERKRVVYTPFLGSRAFSICSEDKDEKLFFL